MWWLLLFRVVLSLTNYYYFFNLQMRRGFNRLQATWRARKLTRDYRLMRARVMGLQRRCRGFIARERFHRRLHSIIKLQSHFRKIIAKRKVHVMRVERQKRLEAERLRREEEERLRKQMAEEEARREAERLHQVRDKLKKISWVIHPTSGCLPGIEIAYSLYGSCYTDPLKCGASTL